MEEKQLYAIDRLEQAKRTILLAKEEMPAARKKIEKQLQKDPNGAKDWYQTLQSQQARLLGALDSCRLSLVEMELPDLAAAALSLEKAVAKFRLSTPDYSRFCDTLEAFVKGMPDANDKTTSTAIIGRMMNNVKMGFYPTDPEHVKLITKGIEFPDGVTTNLLDPCCGDGVALRLIATGNNCYAYGVELDEYRAEVSSLLRQVQDADQIPELTQLPEKSYPLPARPEKVLRRVPKVEVPGFSQGEWACKEKSARNP